MVRKLGLLLMGALIGGGVVFALNTGLNQPVSAQAAGVSTYRQLSIFGDIFERVRASYVTEPTEEELIENAINGMLTSLDPHSSYLNPKDFSDMRVQTRGEFGGLGIEVTMEDDLIKVVTPIDDTPAFKAGVLAGDLITHLDGEEVVGMSLAEAVDKMRGPVNTDIVITVRREGADGPIDITITRDIVRIQSV
ncbi:MAG: PDZ domain-containing protein, partial [Pseudomonadota bacterium]